MENTIPKITKSKKSKCSFCKKKLTLVDKTIKNCNYCNKQYCLRCTQPEKHSCSDISRNITSLPKIITDKMEKL